LSELSTWLAVALGGALGALARATTYRVLERIEPPGTRGLLNRLGIAHATVIVNVLGSFALGLALGALPQASGDTAGWARLFWTTGVCGSLSTFSTLCADAVGLLRRGDPIRFGIYLLAQVGLGLGARALGQALTR
jgi:CrcB protein